jgi:hypothetical protein
MQITEKKKQKELNQYPKTYGATKTHEEESEKEQD